MRRVLQVMLETELCSGQQFAVKYANAEEDEWETADELACLQSLGPHEHIVRLIGQVRGTGPTGDGKATGEAGQAWVPMGVVLELCNAGSLNKHCRKNVYNLRQYWAVALQVCCHSLTLLHLHICMLPLLRLVALLQPAN